MITTFFLSFFYSFISFILSILPVGSLPSIITTALSYFWYILNSFSYVFPVAALFEALLFIFAFDVALIVWHFIQWIIKKIPGMQ
jgi:hypothetical protein